MNLIQSLQQVENKMRKTSQKIVINQATKTKGYIQKKSRGILTSWVKRYYIIINNKLHYYLDQALDNKKGEISIKKIGQIHILHDNQFVFEYVDRVYEMKCSSKQQRDLWVASLKLIKDKIIQQFESQISPPKSPRKIKNKDKKSRKKSLNMTQTYNDIKQILSITKLNKLVKQFTLEQLENRFIYLKSAVGIYWLLSSRALDYNEKDSDLITVNHMKPYSPNKLYYVDPQMKIKEVCATDKITNTTLINNTIFIDIDKGKQYNIDVEDMMSNSIIKFQKRLKKAIKSYQEYYNIYKLKISKNIDLMIQSHSSNASSFQENIMKQFQKISSFKINKLANGLQLLQYFQLIVNYVKSFVNACKVKGCSKKFIKDFFKFFHKIVYPILYEGWNITYNTFKDEMVGQFCDIVYQYQVIIKDYLHDSRLADGVRMLFKIYLRKKQQLINKKIKDSLIKSQVIEKQNYLSNTANILIMENLLQTIKKLKLRSQTEHNFLQQAIVLKRMFFQYCSRITQHFNNSNEINILIGTCNDVALLIQYISKRLNKELSTNSYFLKQFDRLFVKEVNGILFNTQIVLIKRIFFITFMEIDRKILSKNLGQIDIGQVTLAIEERIKKIVKVRNDVKQNIYMTAFDEVCYFYFQCIIKYTNQNQFTAQQICGKINNDLNRIKDAYINYLGEQKINFHISDLQQIVKFINCELSDVKNKFQNLKRVFGGVLNQTYAKNFINLKNGNNDQKKKALQQCLQILNSTQNKLDNLNQNYRQSFLQNWNHSRSRKSTIANNSIQQKQQINLTQLSKSNNGGYLQKQKFLKTIPTMYMKYYYQLKGGKLLEYENEKSQNSLSFISLQNIRKCFINPDEKSVIYLELEDAKYNFKASNNQQARIWLEKIYQQIGNPYNQTDAKSQLFKDFQQLNSTGEIQLSKKQNQVKIRKNSECAGCCAFSNFFL